MSQRTTQFVALIMAAVFLAGASFTVPQINQQRKDIALAADPTLDAGAEGSLLAAGDGTDAALQDERLPPHITVAIAALGTFRGLIVDILWYRANELKEEGKFYEANTLSQWITTLQPRFPVVWEFHAWNMAYNISVMTKTSQERWDWVHKGIKLLRDRGIKYNPRAVRLYKELSWIYFHKIGDMSDDAHWYYKQRIAEEWGELLGAPTLGLTTEEAVEEFRPIADAPIDIETVLEEHPDVQKLLDALTKLEFSIDTPEHRIETLRMFGQTAMYNYTPQPIFLGFEPTSVAKLLVPKFKDEKTREDVRALMTLLQSESMEPAIRALLAHLRHRVLIESYRMKPKEMFTCMELFGPLDWRHPCAHSLYWSREGTNMAERLIGKEEQEEIDYLNTFRQNVFSIQSLMRGGVVSYDPITEYINHEADPRFIDSYTKARGYAIDKIPQDEHKMSVEDSYSAGHENFLLQSAYFCYIYGDEKRAVKYWKSARDLYGQNPYNIRNQTYVKGFEEWMMDYLNENFETMANARQFIGATIRRGIQEGLAINRSDRWEYYLGLSKKAHRSYNKNTTVTHLTKQNRRDLPPFKDMLDEIYINYMQMPYNHPIQRSRIWKNTPLKIRQNTFQRLQPVLYNHARSTGLLPESLFPAPKDYVIRDVEQDQSPDEGILPEDAAATETQ